MSGDNRRVTRREALAVGIASVAGLVTRRGTAKKSGGSVMSVRMPVAFVPHAGGPISHVEMGVPRSELDPLVHYWKTLRDITAAKPKALLAVAAHWEESVPTVMSSPNPPMLYDYSGFPPDAYKITWPAPGNPALA